MSHWYSLRLHSLYLLYLQKPVPTAQVKCTRSLTEINLDVTTSTYQSQSSQTPERYSSSPEQLYHTYVEHNTELPASPPNVQLQTVTLLNG